MSIVKIGIESRSLAPSFRKAIQLASQFEADGVAVDARKEIVPAELSETGLRQIRKMLADQRLGVSAVLFSTRYGYASEVGMEQRLAATRAAMKLAYQIGARVVSAPLGDIPEVDSAAWRVLMEAVLSLARYGDHVGARFIAQTSGSDDAALRRVLNATPERTIGVDLQPANYVRHGDSALDAIDTFGPDIAHLRACDAVRDLGAGAVEQTPLGRGAVDYPAILARLESHGYRGWATIGGDGRQTPDDFANAVQFLRNVD